jgi:hypothetical protein
MAAFDALLRTRDGLGGIGWSRRIMEARDAAAAEATLRADTRSEVVELVVEPTHRWEFNGEPFETKRAATEAANAAGFSSGFVTDRTKLGLGGIYEAGLDTSRREEAV